MAVGIPAAEAPDLLAQPVVLPLPCGDLRCEPVVLLARSHQGREAAIAGERVDHHEADAEREQDHERTEPAPSAARARLA